MAIGGANETFVVRAAQSSFGRVQKLDLTEAKEVAEYPELVVEKNFSQLLYSDVYTGTDVQYDLQSSRVKESIIMESYDSKLRGYRYALNTGSMIPELQEDGSIYFYDETEEEIVMVMPAPYLVDAADAYNHDIQVSLTGQNGSYTLIYLLPQSWLAATDRAWPVILDPVVKPAITINNITDHTVAQDNDTIPKNNDELTCGRSSGHGLMRIFLKFEELPEITSSQVIVAAKIKLYKGGTGETSSAMEVHKVEENWNINTLSWANQPNHTTSVEDVNMVCESGRYTWCVTDIVRNWYTTENTGMMFKLRDSEETSGYNNYRDFRSSDYSENNNYQPNLTITFFDSNGLEDHWNYVSASAGRAGTGHVNTYSGNLTWVRDDIGFGGNLMPVSISHVYNLNDANSNDFGVGYGWRTNYHQRVDDYNSSYYVWEDGDGTEHYFEKLNSTTFIAEDDSGLTLSTSANFDKITGEDYVITDIYGNASYFDTNKRLMCMVNNQKTKSYILITYIGDTNKIDTITDGIGRKYQFTYENDLLSRITCKTAAGTEISYVDFDYSQNYGTTSVENENTYTTSITDRDGKTATYTYKVFVTEEPQEDNTTIKYYNYVLTSAQDIDGYKLQYTYQDPNEDYQTHRVKTIEESDGNALGGKLTLTYDHNQTVMEDVNGNKQILQYNNYGNVVSIQDGQGRAQYAKYAANSTTDTGKANQLTFSSKLQYTVSNLLTNSSFESTPTWVYQEDGSTTSTENNISTTHTYMGNQSLCVQSSVRWSDTFAVNKDETYTFSAYVKTEGRSAALSLGGETVSLEENTDWTRLEVSYTADEDTIICPALDIFSGTGSSGNVYMDCVQFELAPTASRYNLVENGDFRNDLNNWNSDTTENDDGEDDKDYKPAICSNPGAPQLDDKCVTTSGDPKSKNRLKQTINVSGEKGDVFVFGAWAQADSAPLFDGASSKGTRHFCVAATFQYEDDTDQTVAAFNPGNETQWQYVSGVMVAEEDYSSITIQVSYNYNANEAKFDGIQLFKEEFGTSYGYDDDGNVTSVTDIMDKKTEYTYNSKHDLTKEELPTGLIRRYEYDDYHNVTKIITENEKESFQTEHFEYDKYGNKTVEQVKVYGTNNTTVSRITYTYTSDGNRLLSKEDAVGNVTNYNYDPNTNVLLSVQYPNDTDTSKTTYTYDEMLRTKTVSAAVSTDDTLGVEYVYTDDYLTSIKTGSEVENATDGSRNGTVYNFTYGDFGLRESVSVGNKELARYTYATRNNYLKTLAYGNGDSVQYDYDDYGRVKEQKYYYKENPDSNDKKLDSTISYQYDASGELAAVTDSATNITTKYYYDFAGKEAATEQRIKTEDDEYLLHLRLVGHYDEYGRLESKDYTFLNDSYTTTYTYDENSSVSSAEIGGLGTIDYTYDKLFRLDTVGTGVNSRDYEYWVSEDNQKLSYQIAKLSYPQLAEENASYDFQYTYDANGNIKTYTEPGKDTITYTYDSQNQLTGVTVGNNISYSYTYDNLGNIKSKTKIDTTKSGTDQQIISTYTYSKDVNTSDWKDDWKDLLVAYNDDPITYDAIGNPTVYYNGWNFTWKHGRQMATATNGSDTLTFSYNADGLRTSKTVNDVTYTYYYADGKLIRQTDGTTTLDFYYDDSGLPYALKQGETIYYYIVNVQGDVLAIVDSNGANAATYEYDPYGKVLSASGNLANVNPLRYRGYIYDSESQLYYLQSRYYDPETGRFINADDYVTTGRELLSNNMFAYCYNNPAVRTDPSGEFPWLVVGIIIACVAVIGVDHALAANQPDGGYVVAQAKNEKGAKMKGLYAEGNGFEVNHNGITVCDINVGLISTTISGKSATIEPFDCLTANAVAALDWSGIPSLDVSAVASIYSPSIEVVVPLGLFTGTISAEAYIGGVGAGIELDTDSGKFKITPPFAGVGGTYSVDFDLVG